MKNINGNINSTLQFQGYKVITLRFELGESHQEEYHVKPQFMKKIFNIDDTNFEVNLGCKIVPSLDEPFPFTCEVVLSGQFSIDENCENRDILIHENSVAILFPYLRSTLSALTLEANQQPLILPTLNIVNLFKEYDADMVIDNDQSN